MKIPLLIIITFIILLNITAAKAYDPSSLALNYLIQRFGSSNYEIVKLEKLGNIDLIGITDNKNYYTFQVDSSNNRILNFEARTLNLNFNIKNTNSSLEVECLGSKEEGFGLTFYQPLSVFMEYYYEGYAEDKNLSLLIKKMSLIEFQDLNGNGIPDKGENIHVINLDNPNLTREEVITSSIGKAVEVEITYAFKLINNATMKVIFSVIPSSSRIANLTSEQKKNEYSISVEVYLSNYKKYFENSNLMMGMELNKGIITASKNDLIFYNGAFVSLILSSPYRLYYNNDSVYLRLNNSSFTSFNISYIQLKQWISSLNSEFTVLISSIFIALVAALLVIRYRMRKKAINYSL